MISIAQSFHEDMSAKVVIGQEFKNLLMCVMDYVKAAQWPLSCLVCILVQ